MSIRNPFAGWNKNFALLAVAVFSVGYFFATQITLTNNFLVDRFGIEAHQLGYVEALRETPGFLNVFFIALMVHLAPSLVAVVALVLMGLGMSSYAAVNSVPAIALLSIMWSIGFHCWMPLQQAMALRFSPAGNKGKWLGQLNSVSSAAWPIAIGFSLLTFSLFSYEGLFVIAGIITIIGSLPLLLASRQKPAVREKGFILKRRYGLYYLLNFLEGCRKQMFVTFAMFALIKIHGMPVNTTMILVLINQLLLTFVGPLMGRLVDRYGERTMLGVNYLGLIFIFVGYALVQHRPTLYVLYCLDSLIFFGGIALTTYLHKIAPEQDLKPTISMGVTINHIAAVVAPLVGGLAWDYFGYQVIFFSGAVLAVVSLLVTRWVDPEGLLARERTAALEPAI